MNIFGKTLPPFAVASGCPVDCGNCIGRSRSDVRLYCKAGVRYRFGK